ncbi:MAG: DUF4832 domain-containing protein [Clostridium sp.]|nr:DUF4832 domain-containing protein [Acetatifactor muris]MCM1526260.1 DUF4832 domain-containing protein [Bacteroides sp.]MCM1562923.1 DUF4832 domain-containing protein [Clostridium sp.]
MGSLFHKRQQEKWIWQKGDFSELPIQLSNPARGWYRIHMFPAEAEPDLRDLAYLLENDRTLEMVFIDIGAFRDSDPDETCMGRIRTILRFFADRHRDIILRVAYDHEGRAPEREPRSFEQVLRHMERIGEILEEFPREIFVYQGLLIGNWGEMHTSHFLSAAHLSQLKEVLYRHKGDHIYAAVRRPAQWRMLHRDGKGSDMGLFDDGIFGSGSDLGTFGTYTKEAAGPGEAWSREEELAFEEQLCRTAPNGGEAVLGEDYTERLSSEQMLQDLRRMHITYLNSGYDERILKLWKERRYGGQGVWKGQSLYDYIGAHMGYRFWVKDANLVSSGGMRKDVCVLEITIVNTGFANLYQEAELYLEWTDEFGQFKRQSIPCDLRKCDSGCAQSVRCSVKGSESTCYLALRRKWDGAVIRLANRSDDSGRMILGSLQRRTV